MRKDGLAAGDHAAQVHEDAACLVFLETQLDPLADQLGDDRTVEVLRKTATKMSPAGLAAAGGARRCRPAGAPLLRRAPPARDAL